MKTCSKCGETKLIDSFGNKKGGKNGLMSYCKECNIKQRKRWYQKNKEKVKDTHYKYKFGITSEQYDNKLLKQNFCCAICEKHMAYNKRRLVVDHCHTTNKVRALLCDNCNVLLGHAKDSVEVLQKAISYLKEHND